MADKFIYIFFGKVFPERAYVKIPEVTFNYNIVEEVIKGTAFVEVIMSQIIVKFESETIVGNIYSLKNYIEDSVRLIVDSWGYILSCGYDIEITSMIDSIGYKEVFGVNFDNVEKSIKARPKKFNEVFDLLSRMDNNYLRLCLSDLREAIRKPKDTAFFCYRAIESLRQYICDEYDCKKDKNRWEKFNTVFGLTIDDFEDILEYAKPARHGENKYISGEVRVKIINFTYSIIDKFIVYAYDKLVKSKQTEENT